MAQATAATPADGVPLTETDCKEMLELIRHFDDKNLDDGGF